VSYGGSDLCGWLSTSHCPVVARLPPCFSRPIAHYAIKLNDAMPDSLRDELLLPFVPRLAGTADTPDVERMRCEFIMLQNVRRITPYILRKTIPFERFAIRCETVRSVAEARKVMNAVKTLGPLASVPWLAKAFSSFPPSGYYCDLQAAALYANSISDPTEHRIIFTMATEILDGAIRIGNHQDLECRHSPERHTITEAIAA
jgi:hypothetical protein